MNHYARLQVEEVVLKKQIEAIEREELSSTLEPTLDNSEVPLVHSETLEEEEEDVILDDEASLNMKHILESHQMELDSDSGIPLTGL